MIKNNIYYVSKQQAEEKLNDLKKDQMAHIGIIQGMTAKTWKDYLTQIRMQYLFPTIEDVFDGYSDWMEDLSWLNKDSYSLFIFDYELFMSKEPKNKKIVMSMFLEDILPWWDTDVTKYCVGGEVKPFNVYLID